MLMFIFAFAILLVRLDYLKAVTHGYEQYGNLPGHFWIFNSSGIIVVDPSTNSVVKSISSPTTAWGDCAYIRDQAQIKHYLFCNDAGNGRTFVFDGQSMELLTKLSYPAGAKPLHMYAVYYYDQVWSHDDTSGTFDVFRLPQVRYRSTTGIQASTVRVSIA